MARFFADDPESEAWLEAAADDQPDMALRALVPAADALEALRGQVLNLTPAELIDAVVTTAVVIGRIERWGDHATRLDDLEALRGFAATYESECAASGAARPEEHTSELQSLMRISYAVFCLKKK